MIQSTLRNVALKSSLKSFGRQNLQQRRTYLQRSNGIDTIDSGTQLINYGIINSSLFGHKQQKCAYIAFRTDRRTLVVTSTLCDSSKGKQQQSNITSTDKNATKQTNELTINEQQSIQEGERPCDAANNSANYANTEDDTIEKKRALVDASEPVVADYNIYNHHWPPQSSSTSLDKNSPFSDVPYDRNGFYNAKKNSARKFSQMASRHLSRPPSYTSVRKSSSNSDDGINRSAPFTSFSSDNSGSSAAGGKGSGSGDSLKCPKCGTQCSPTVNSKCLTIRPPTRPII